MNIEKSSLSQKLNVPNMTSNQEIKHRIEMIDEIINQYEHEITKIKFQRPGYHASPKISTVEI